MAARMRGIDWASTSLGPVGDWPQSLRSALGICVESAFPIAIYWGPTLSLLYNDAWSSIPGEKHPWALGRPAVEVWPEIWDAIGPMFEGVFATGTATYLQDSLLLMHRHGYTEECYFNYTFTPIRGEGGVVEGIFNAVVETTYRVIAERRSGLLRDTAQAVAGRRSVDEICARGVQALTAPGLDATFALVYTFDRTTDAARLQASAGVPADTNVPLSIDLSATEPWPMRAVAAGIEPVVVPGLEAAIGPLPGGAWPEPTHTAIAVPLLTGESDRPSGCLILGASPRRAVDAAYIQFAAQAGAHIATALTSAIAFDAERKRAEALAVLDRAKTAFFSNVSHEFRTPLTLLIGPLQDALASDSPALRGADLETAYRNAQRLLRLVNGLLDFVRLESGRVDPAFEPVDIGQLTAEYASTFRSAMERAGLRLRIDLPAQIDDVYVDRELWETVILNLLSNALKFTFDGEIAVTVAAVDDGAVEVRIADTGVGIPAEHLPHVFDRFYRVDQPRSRTHEGSGIGLALVRELVQLHGGSVDVESAPQRGTRFTIRLRRGSAHLSPEHVGHARSLRALTPPALVAESLRWVDPVSRSVGAVIADQAAAGAEHRLLVVDDNLDLREYIGRLLASIGAVTAVSTGAEALDALRREPFDLVLTDVMMPSVGGFELLAAIRADARLRATPVIMLSARAGEEARLEGLERGADDYLVKPFTARELIAKTINHLALARAGRAVREERDRLRDLLGQVPTVVNFLAGPDLVFEYAHPLAVKAAGGRVLQGRRVIDAFPEYDGQPFVARLRQVYETGEPAVLTEVMASLDRSQTGERTETYWNSVYLPVRNAAGAVEGVMTFDVDVTEQVQARRALERQAEDLEAAREAAEQASRAKDEFLAVLGHELRNPLSPIATAVQLLRLRGHESREVAVIERQVKHLTRLVDDLLDVSRVTRGKVELHRRAVDLTEILARAIEMASPLLEQRQQHLDVDVPPGLVVDADVDRLAQVLSNVLVNAAKYSERETRIGVDARRHGERIVVAVTDRGMGIPPDLLERVFDPFVQQPQTSERSHGGLGLGLAIARNLVERHGGTIRAESGGSRAGSRFVIELPAATDSAQPADVAAVPAPVVSSPRWRVLVVDDNVDAAEMLAAVLRQAGYEVRVASDGPTALAAARPFRPHVALLDIGLPVMDGYELAARLNAASDGMPLRLIAVTGYGQDIDRQRSAAAGFSAHLLKPIDLAALDGVLQDAVSANG